jgi:hypothetical protein
MQPLELDDIDYAIRKGQAVARAISLESAALRSVRIQNTNRRYNRRVGIHLNCKIKRYVSAEIESRTGY